MKLFNSLMKLGLLIGIIVSGMGEWSVALAEEGSVPKIDTGDTAWILVSSAFVLCMMLPGLALFYGGLVRSKNVLGTIMHTAVILCLITLVWVICGYSLAFGPDIGGSHWELGVGRVTRRWLRAQSGLCVNDSSSSLHGVSAHVCRHYCRAHNG